MSKKATYVLALLDGKTPEEAREVAGYEGNVSGDAIQLASRVMALKQEVNTRDYGWDSVRSLKLKTEAARKKAEARALEVNTALTQHEELLRAIELLESWRFDHE